MGVKIAVVGGGSTYTPELIEGFLTHRERLPVDELVLFDIDSERLDIVGALAKRILAKREWLGEIVLTGDRNRALDGAHGWTLRAKMACARSIPMTRVRLIRCRRAPWSY